jgi:hypothetical protein
MLSPEFIYYKVLPTANGSFDYELNSCLEEIKAKTSAEILPVKLTIFTKASSSEEFLRQQQFVKKVISKEFRESPPTYNVLSQPPVLPYSVCIEAVFVKNNFQPEFKEHNTFPYVVIGKGEFKMIIASGLKSPGEIEPLADGVRTSFDIMYSLLSSEGFTFDDIIRQWNYVPEICSEAKIEGISTQNYQIFNEVRHLYYSKFMSRNGFPAATGIGQQYGNFSLDFIAYKGKANYKAFKIESPVQKNPYQYGQQVLAGDPLNKIAKHAPEFERAKLLLTETITMYVSGTAAIEGEKTIGIGNVEVQTLSTIKNIEALTSIENIQKNCSITTNKPLKFNILRVYVLKKNDIEKVEQVLKNHNCQPYIIVQAEICRRNLLVEIEAEMG